MGETKKVKATSSQAELVQLRRLAMPRWEEQKLSLGSRKFAMALVAAITDQFSPSLGKNSARNRLSPSGSARIQIEETGAVRRRTINEPAGLGTDF